MEELLRMTDLKALERCIDKLCQEQMTSRYKAREGRLYYRNDNDIRRRQAMEDSLLKQKRLENPLRNADFRISHNWHQLLVNQKVAYLFTYPPIFDTGDNQTNQRINGVLGDQFAQVVKDLAIDAANTGRAWLHVWRDGDDHFCYAPVMMEEIYPVYGDELQTKIESVIRIYDVWEEEKAVTKIELWDAREAVFYYRQKAGLTPDNRHNGSNRFCHQMGFLPFVPFDNNRDCLGDLPMVKDLIDQYDLVTSGFANDLADIQEVIFVLRNYGGEDLNTFLSELKRYKAIKVDGDVAVSGGVETLKIEIPVEARVQFLDLMKKQIFIAGQGVNPDPYNFGNSSGVALKYHYSLLEIKAGLLETEFRAAFKHFLRLILHYLELDPELPAVQIYTRNGIENEAELAEIAVKSQGIISRRTILQNHPWVEAPAAELDVLTTEQQSTAAATTEL